MGVLEAKVGAEWGQYLTREKLINRVEYRIGPGCFGAKTWQEAFYRDMRFVRKAFSEAGYVLKYSRSHETPGYYLKGEGRLHEDIQTAIRGALAELDDAQIEIYRHLPPSQKFSQATSMIDFGRKVSSQANQKRQTAKK